MLAQNFGNVVVGSCVVFFDGIHGLLLTKVSDKKGFVFGYIFPSHFVTDANDIYHNNPECYLSLEEDEEVYSIESIVSGFCDKFGVEKSEGSIPSHDENDPLSPSYLFVINNNLCIALAKDDDFYSFIAIDEIANVLSSNEYGVLDSPETYFMKGSNANIESIFVKCILEEIDY
jgi:hypothetical protein